MLQQHTITGAWHTISYLTGSCQARLNTRSSD